MPSLPVGEIICGDCLDVMRGWPDGCVDCCVTSPPYWGLRDYGCDGQLGLEPTPEAYVARMVEVFAEVRRVLKPEGTLWLNLGDSYAASSNTGGTNSIQGTAKRIGAMTDRGHDVPLGCKPKDLIGIPWRVAFALQSDGWYLRSDIIWAKPNPMPESVTDRPTKSHEHIFLLSKNARYHYDAAAIAEPSTGRTDVGVMTRDFRLNHGGEWRDTELTEKTERNARDVWTIATHPYSGAHFATFPPELPRRCILAGCPPQGIVLDPFFGSGTVGMVAESLGRRWVGIELNPEYCEIARKRTAQRGLFA